MATYSLTDVHAGIVGPGGGFSIGSDAGVSEEAISYAYSDDKNTMQIGGGGAVMHSLHAGKGGTITVRLLKTSPVNALLAALYNFQTTGSTRHGQNVITIADIARGDVITGREVAFKKMPDNSFAKAGNVLEWVFDVGRIDVLLGAGAI
jgi:hypothetical protein